MSQSYIGEIRMVGFNFAPNGWALCNGQTMAISQNETLYTLIGTTYGGDGVNTFALPNMQSRIPVHQGQGAGLSPYVLGQSGGTESVILTPPQLPAHSHSLQASGAGATSTDPTGRLLAASSVPIYVDPAANPSHVVASTSVTGGTGSSQPHDNIQPTLCLNFVISLFGIFPSQS